MKIFIDTNVLVDFLLQRSTFYKHAVSLINRIENRDLEASISAISLNNVYYVARKTVGAVRARSMVSDLLKLFEVVPLDSLLVAKAIHLPIADFEDAIQAASAQVAGAVNIVTRNQSDFGTITPHAISPEEMLATLDA